MNNTSPPIHLLPYFDAAARHESFTRAARELDITPSAMSQRIASLEEHLSLLLFERGARRVRLTDAGRFYAEICAGILHKHEQGFEQLQNLFGSPSMRVGTTPIVAHELLIPRIGDFHARNDELDLRIEASMGLVDLHREPVDVCIRTGDEGAWPGLYATKLVDIHATFACSPRMQAHKNGRPWSIHEVVGGATLITAAPNQKDWRMVCDAYKLPMPPAERLISCSNHIEAALLAAQGKGVMIAILPTMQSWFSNGRLVHLHGFESSWSTPLSYFAVCLSGREHAPHIEAFMMWVKTLFEGEVRSE